MAQNAQIFFSHDIHVIFQNYLILCQRTGLIRTQNVNCPEVLNRVQILHDGLFLAHGDCTLGKAGCHDHRQHLWCQTDSDRNAEKECFQPISLCNTVDDKNKRHHNQHKADKHPGHCIDTLCKAGFHCFLCHRGCHGTKECIVANRNDDTDGTAGNHIASHESNVLILGNVIVLGCGNMGSFFNRFTFPGQTGLADKQILCVNNTQIGWNHIPCGEVDNIACHHILQRNLLLYQLFSIYGAGCSDHSQQFFCRITTAGLLYKTKYAGKKYHAQDNHHSQTVEILFCTAEQLKVGENHICHCGHQCQTEKNSGEGIDKCTCQTLGQRFLFLLCHLVDPILRAVSSNALARKSTQSCIHTL